MWGCEFGLWLPRDWRRGSGGSPGPQVPLKPRALRQGDLHASPTAHGRMRSEKVHQVGPREWGGTHFEGWKIFARCEFWRHIGAIGGGKERRRYFLKNPVLLLDTCRLVGILLAFHLRCVAQRGGRLYALDGRFLTGGPLEEVVMSMG